MYRQLKRAILDESGINIGILNYRNTPLSGLNVSPAQLFINRRLRSKMPSKPNHLSSRTQASKKVEINKQRYYFDKHAGQSHRKLKIGDKIKIHYARQAMGVRNNNKHKHTRK